MASDRAGCGGHGQVSSAALGLNQNAASEFIQVRLLALANEIGTARSVITSAILLGNLNNLATTAGGVIGELDKEAILNVAVVAFDSKLSGGCCFVVLILDLGVDKLDVRPRGALPRRHPEIVSVEFQKI